MKTHTRIPTKTSIYRANDNPLARAHYDALKARYLADPKLANEVIAGECAWPPEDRDLDWLYNVAVDKAEKAIADAVDHAPYGSIAVTTFCAARDAIGILADRAEDANRAEQDCIDYGPDRQQERA